MSRTILRRPLVKSDLIDIWSYIADDNESAAERELDRPEATLNMLADQPEAGRLRPELRSGLRSFAVGNYIIFYQPAGDGIEVLRVSSGYQDFDQIDLY